MGDRYGFTMPVFDCLISKMTLGRCSWRVALLGDSQGSPLVEEGERERGELGQRSGGKKRGRYHRGMLVEETDRGWEGEGQRQRENVSSFQEEIQSEELRGAAGRLDFWCIGVLIPALNYPLSWAQLGPLVKTPPLFVLRNR